MAKMMEDMKFSNSYSKKDLLEAIECLQHNYKGLKETYDRAVSLNYKLAEILKSCNIKMDWIKLEVIKNKQIDIKELIPFMRDGWVAMNRDYSWRWFNSKPDMQSCYWTTPDDDMFDVISDSAFCIKPAKDWTKSLIRIKGE